MITYRPATEADLPLVTDQVIALTMHYKDAFKTPCFDLTMETVKDNVLAFIEDYIIVLRDGQTVAFYLLGDEFGLTHLEELIVLPQYRNQGIGYVSVDFGGYDICSGRLSGDGSNAGPDHKHRK